MFQVQEEWMHGFETDNHRNILPTMTNFTLIFENDVSLKNIVYNELGRYFDTVGPLPWREGSEGWQQSDWACLELFIEQTYGIYAPSRCREAFVAFITTKRRHHPIKNYLEQLDWDGELRLETLLIDHLKAPDNRYTRAVTKKALVAAVARIYEPGIKFDNVLVLCGAQGIGKSSLFSVLGKNWYSDSMTISDMKDKTACEKMQGVWIIELGELAGIRRVDVEIVKSFISRQNDLYRPAYGQFVENHKRTCIIVGTTNSQNGFLRDFSGNRRFWPVKLAKRSGDPWTLNEIDVDQIWAEAYYYYLQGETLYLDRTDEIEAEKNQRDALETDPRSGLILDYLLDPSLQEVCLMELWCDCLGKHRQDMRRRDANELEAILYQSGEWELYPGNSSGKMRTEKYGIQRTFVRKSEAYYE
jgi:predicted P-loop ATPase